MNQEESLFFSYKLNNMKNRTKQYIVHIATRVVVVKIVKIRSYKRIRNGKIERVRSHYRRY